MWRDLLLPKWKGKISLSDPTTTGGANAWFATMSNHVLSLDYMRELARQEPVIIRDQRLQAEWIAHGKYPLDIALPAHALAEFMKAGATITGKALGEGAYITQGSGGIALINRAPHPTAARVFVNWLLAKERQTVVSQANRIQSARIDVSADFLFPWEKRQEGYKYVDERNEQAQFEQQKMLDVAKEVFGALLK